MSAPPPTGKTPLHLIAKACLALPLLAFGIGILFSLVRASDAKVAAGAVRLLLLMVGFTLAFVASFGNRGPGRERLARYGVAGLVVNGVYLFVSAALFPSTLTGARPQLAHRPGAALSVSAREAAVPAMNPSLIHYTNIDFSKPGEALQTVTSAAQGQVGEDAAVLRAWSGVLTQLFAAHREVEHTTQALAAADVLNPATITNATRRALSDQFIARRLLANHYSSALHRWEQVLTSVEQIYADELSRQAISSERVALESQRLANVSGICINPLIQVCVAEQKIASQYARAISAMESCHPFNERSAFEEGSDAASSGKDLQEQLAKLEQAKQNAHELQQKWAGAH